MPPTPWPSRYATCIPRRRFPCRRHPALEVSLSLLRSMVWAVLLLVLAPGTNPAVGLGRDGPAVAQIRFTFDNPKLQPPKYAVTVGEDGNGHFRSEPSGPPADGEGMPAEAQDRPIHISKAVRE